MVEFSIQLDYLILGGAIFLILVTLKVIKAMSDQAEKTNTKPTYGPVDISTLKVKQETIFLEDKLNAVMDDKRQITLKEYRKLVSSAKGFRLLADGRRRALLDCRGFTNELRTEIERTEHIPRVAELFDLIEGVNKVK